MSEKELQNVHADMDFNKSHELGGMTIVSQAQLEREQEAVLGDYIPSGERRDARKNRKHQERFAKDEFQRDEIVLVEPGVDYRDGVKTAAVRKKREDALSGHFNELLERYKKAFQRYLRAKKKKEELEEIDELDPKQQQELLKANEIVSKGPPITKAELKRKAQEELIKKIHG